MPNNQPRAYTKEELEEAIKAALALGGHTWTLEGLNDEKAPRVLFLGCHGMGKGVDEKTWQEIVAQLINKVLSEHPELKPDIIVFLGDNHYPKGASSAIDEKFYTCFYDVYDTKIPCFFVSGNHDANFDEKSSKNPLATKGEKVSFNQVIHHFLPDGIKFKTSDEILKYFQQEKLQIKDLQLYNFPSLFYSLVLGDLQLFGLDSNFMGKAFLSYMKGSTEANNQIAFLKASFSLAEKNGKGTCINLHTPFETTAKRSAPHKYDTHHFLSDEEITELNKIFRQYKLIADNMPDVRSHNEIIKLICKCLGINADVVNCAHDHLMEIIDTFLKDEQQTNSNNNVGITQNSSAKSFLQFIFGAGGGHKQEQKSFAKHPHVKYHTADEEYGFGILTYENKQFQLDIFTTDNPKDLTYQHLTYKNHEFVRNTKNIDVETEKFREKLLAICDAHISSLKENELAAKKINSENKNTWWGYVSSVRFFPKTPLQELVANFVYYVDYNNTITRASPYLQSLNNMTYEINCIHKIRNLLNQTEPPNLSMIVEFVCDLEVKLPFNNESAQKIFFDKLNNELMSKERLQNFKIDRDEFFKKEIVLEV